MQDTTTTSTSTKLTPTRNFNTTNNDTKRKKMRSFLPRRGGERIRRFGSDTKRSFLRSFGEGGGTSNGGAGYHHSPSSDRRMIRNTNSWGVDDSGSVSSISTAPSFFHPRIYSHQISSCSSSRSVSSQTSAKQLALEALERESQSSLAAAAAVKHSTPQDGFLRSTNISPLSDTQQQQQQQQQQRALSPIPDIYVFRRLNYDSSSSTERSRGSNTTTISPPWVHSTTNNTTSLATSYNNTYQPTTTTNISILLLSPTSTNRFEWITIPYSSQTTVQQILQDIIPTKATDIYLREQSYVGLCRRSRRLGEEDVVERFHPHHRLPLPNTDDVLLMEGIENDSNDSFFITILPNYSVSECITMSDSILFHRTNHSTPQPNNNNKLIPASSTNPLEVLGWMKHSSSQRQSSSSLSLLGAGGGYLKWILQTILISFLFLGLTKHWKLSSPLRPGDTMHQGEIRSKWGLLSSSSTIVPFFEPTVLQLKSNGILAYYHKNQLVWEIQPIVESTTATKTPWWKGGKKSNGTPLTTTNTTSTLFSSLYVDFNGNIFINGMKTFIHHYHLIDDNTDRRSRTQHLSPWPFALDPNFT